MSRAAGPGDTGGGDSEQARIADVYARRGMDPRYSWFSPGHAFIHQDREWCTLRLLARHGLRLEDLRILDVGCGKGEWIRDLVKWGALPHRLTGIDLLPDRIDEARRLCPPGVALGAGDATSLETPHVPYDLIVLSTVMSSILSEAFRQRLAREVLRVLAPGGHVLWYDMRVDNPRNPDVKGLKRRSIESLFPGCSLHLRRMTLAPPIVRTMAPRSRVMCHLLERITPLCTHYLGLFRKNGSGVS